MLELRRKGDLTVPGEIYHDHDTERDKHEEASPVEDVLEPHDRGKDE
jgi:hypothetical protein